MTTTRRSLTAICLAALLAFQGSGGALADNHDGTSPIRVDGIDDSELIQGGDTVTTAIQGQFVPGHSLISPAKPTVTIGEPGSGVTAVVQTYGLDTIAVDVAVSETAVAGLYDIEVKQLEQTATCEECLRIGPVLDDSDAVSPTSARNDTTADVTVTVTGDGFHSDADVSLQLPDVGFEGSETLVIDPGEDTVTTTSITATIPAAALAGQAPAAWDVVVTNGDGGQDRIVGGFTLEGDAPAVSGVGPAVAGLNGGEPAELVVSGAGLSTASLVTFDPADVEQSGPVSLDENGNLVVPVTVSGTEPTTFDVTVEDTATNTATCTQCFELADPAAVTALSPAQLGQGASGKKLSASGTGLPTNLSPDDVSFGDAGISVTGVEWHDSEHVDLTVDVAPDATPGAATLQIDDPAIGGSSTCDDCLQVNAAPGVGSDAISPPSARQGDEAFLEVTGTGFQPGVTASLGAGITVENIKRPSASRLELSVTVADGAATGARTLAVTNPDGGGASCACFTVAAAAPSTAPAPPTVKGKTETQAPPRGTTTPSGEGYVILKPDGTVQGFGDAANLTSDARSSSATENLVAIALTPTGKGYWALDPAGGIHTFGDAKFLGSLPGNRAKGLPVGDAAAIDVAATPSGHGYYVLDAAGGIHTFGDAKFLGSLPGNRAEGLPVGHSPVASMAVTPGGGYVVLDRAGGIHTFGDARFYGSIPGRRAAGAPIGPVDAVSIALAPGGKGYAVLDAIGGVHTFGNARFLGSIPGLFADGRIGGLIPAQAIETTADGNGYWLFDTNGGVYTFGNATFAGSLPGLNA